VCREEKAEEVKKALFRGPTIPFDAGLADALGGKATTALALQQIHYLGLESPDGWVPISQGKLAGELGCSQNVVAGALKLLRERGLLEARVQEKQTGTYRVNYDAVRELQPHRKFGEWAKTQPDDLPENQPRAPLEQRNGDASLSRVRARTEKNKEQTRPDPEQEQHTSASSFHSSADGGGAAGPEKSRVTVVEPESPFVGAAPNHHAPERQGQGGGEVVHIEGPLRSAAADLQPLEQESA
jgi:hypothetical protein